MWHFFFSLTKILKKKEKMGEKAFYNAYTLGAVLSGLDTLANPVPRVTEWAINENARFESKFPKRSYVRR